jgi:glyoxylase-like metal-dependent hydrolase (beta-lactamase superfamily II)
METQRGNGITRRQLLGTGGLAVAAAMLQAGPAAAAAEGAECPPAEFVPLPQTAFGPPIPQDKGYLVEEIGNGLFWVTEGSYIAVFLETRQGVVVVDAPPTLAQALPAAIAEVTSKQVTHFIYSHTHGDHVGVSGLLFPEAQFMGHEDTAATLARRDDASRRPVPQRTFKKQRTLNFGGQRVELMYPGPNHEPGNIFVWFPDQKTLMWVDVVFPGWVPFKSLALAQDVPGIVAGHDMALALPFETFVGGHLTRLGDRQDVEIAREYIQDVRAASFEALATVSFFDVLNDIGFLDPGDPSFLNQWELFDVYLNAVAHSAEEIVLDKWLGVLGGADVFTFSHCFSTIESIRIDDNAVADFA